jgi:Fe-S-cluster containining protein
MDFEKECNKCKNSVHCCIFKNESGFAFVGIDDARKIKKETKLEYGSFLDYSKLSKSMINALKHDDPALEGALRYLQLDKNRILKLKIKKDGRCIFLDDNHRCEIYDIRPKICKIFPLWAIRLTSNKIKVIRHDSETRCGFLKSNYRNEEDVEKLMTKEEIKYVQKIFREIEKENRYYKNNIRKFIS